MVLYCYRDVVTSFGEVIFSKGKDYEVYKEDGSKYTLLTEKGDLHVFTKEPDFDGKSYKDWFELEE